MPACGPGACGTCADGVAVTVHDGGLPGTWLEGVSVAVSDAGSGLVEDLLDQRYACLRHHSTSLAGKCRFAFITTYSASVPLRPNR